MAEQIGNVILDDTFYPGVDLYCDGTVEDTLLSIVREQPEREYARIIEESGSWPVLYHLSHFRENIVNWLPIDKSMKVLEVGAGCGAITGALSEKAGSVTCIDLSRKRSLINAYRHKDRDNITIKMGNFKDIEPSLDTDYDYVFLIGVFEYGQGYMGSDTPYTDFMNIIRKHCAPNGRIVIAIENKYGLKYFAGCREDHLGSFFSGIEDYPAGGGVRTFSRNGLIRIMQECGITDYHFYYPYPDYKFMTTIYSDEYLPKVGELANNLRNFDRERLLLFDEKNAFDGLIRDNMFQEFSNSFLVVIGSRPEQVYAKFSNDRKPEYAICTTICQSSENYVEKRADAPQAQEHIRSLKGKYDLLAHKYEGCPLSINRCENTDAGVRLEYLQGTTLEQKLDECIHRGDVSGFQMLLDRYQKLADYHEEWAVSDFDLIFSNIMIDDATDEWTLIDYEWTYEKAMSGEKTARRAVFVYMTGPELRRRFLFEHQIAGRYGIREDQLDALQEEELVFQRQVTGDRASMYELYDRMGQKAVPVTELLRRENEQGRGRQFQIYEDYGEGFSEERSKFYPETYREENKQIVLETVFGGENKQLRLDPAMEPCMLYELEISVNGRKVYSLSEAEQNCDGTITVENNGVAADGGVLVFQTGDPNITLRFGETKLMEQNSLLFTAGVEWLSGKAAELLCAGKEEAVENSKKQKGFFGFGKANKMRV